MPYIDSPAAGGRIHIYFEDHGSGDPVVLIGGLSSTVETWGRLAELLAERYRVIRPDNRGSGRTRVEPDQGDRSMAAFAEDVRRLLDGLGLERVHLVGASMGGMIVQQFAVTWPERLLSLTVACSHCGGAAAVAAGEETVRKLVAASSGGAEAVRSGLEVVAHPDSFARRSDVLDYYQWTKETWPHPAEEIQRRMAAIGQYDVSEAIRSLRVPALVITGAQDILVPVENSRRIAERIPGARLALVEEGAHIFFLEQPEAVARELDAHFAAAKAAGGEAAASAR
ncbi:MAG TPA: alpha/beta fold hydrolase [Thermoanaerobaculia bacterium]|nr:alpha/beta fold hydrolase [Thermoanaerobaculia bacterium]